MKNIGRTKVLRVPGGEIYLLRTDSGWIEYRKDQSALMRRDWEKKFRKASGIMREPSPAGVTVPPGWAGELVSIYSPLSYFEPDGMNK